jgi:hypothetical protein
MEGGKGREEGRNALSQCWGSSTPGLQAPVRKRISLLMHMEKRKINLESFLHISRNGKLLHFIDFETLTQLLFSLMPSPPPSASLNLSLKKPRYWAISPLATLHGFQSKS